MPIHRHTGNILKPQVDCYLIAHGRERERKREGERDKQRERDRQTVTYKGATTLFS